MKAIVIQKIYIVCVGTCGMFINPNEKIELYFFYMKKNVILMQIYTHTYMFKEKGGIMKLTWWCVKTLTNNGYG